MIVGRVYIVHTTLARPDPKDKITLCICAAENLFFWINTNASRHGIGQLSLTAADHPALTHDCYLDCSRITTFPPNEIAAAQARPPISRELAQRIVALLLSSPPKTLARRHLQLAIDNLSAI